MVSIAHKKSHWKQESIPGVVHGGPVVDTLALQPGRLPVWTSPLLTLRPLHVSNASGA